MGTRHLAMGRGVLALLAGGVLAAPVWGQGGDDKQSLLDQYEQQLREQRAKEQVHDRTAPRKFDGPAAPLKRPNSPEYYAPQPGEHPIMPALRWAYNGLEKAHLIKDYSATLAKRERINGKLGDYEYMFVKVRNDPFSVYGYFLGPDSLKGQEVMYVLGANNGKLWAHPNGVKHTLVGTISLDPDGVIAMHNQRYPITEIGLLNLVRRLVEVAEQDRRYGECKVNWYQGTKVNNRTCTCIEVLHPVPRRNFLFHIARIFIDDELGLPIRYESWDWPRQQGGQPELIEEYTYMNLQLHQNFTDADFDIRNPNYNFR